MLPDILPAGITATLTNRSQSKIFISPELFDSNQPLPKISANLRGLAEFIVKRYIAEFNTDISETQLLFLQGANSGEHVLFRLRRTYESKLRSYLTNNNAFISFPRLVAYEPILMLYSLTYQDMTRLHLLMINLEVKLPRNRYIPVANRVISKCFRLWHMK